VHGIFGIAELHFDPNPDVKLYEADHEKQPKRKLFRNALIEIRHEIQCRIFEMIAHQST